jgi:hypothetical protein
MFEVSIREGRQSNMASSQLSTTVDACSSSAPSRDFAVASRLTAPRAPAYSARLPDRPTSLFSQELLPARGIKHEANISAQQSAPETHAWFPRSHGHRRWTKGSREPPREGPRSPHALTDFVLARSCSPTHGSRPTNDCTRRPSSGECSPSRLVRAIDSSPCSRDQAAVASLGSV